MKKKIIMINYSHHEIHFIIKLYIYIFKKIKLLINSN